MGTQPNPVADPAGSDVTVTDTTCAGTAPDGTAPDDTGRGRRSGHTAVRRRGPSTLFVALLLLTALIAASVAEDPETVLPRDTTILVERHADPEAGITIPVPVGWAPVDDPVFGSTQLVPGAGKSDYQARILAGRLGPDIPAAAISDDQGAATALAETVVSYVLGAQGQRDDQREVDIANKVGNGHATSYIMLPSGVTGDAGGLVYVAVFGPSGDRRWVVYITETPTKAPSARWVDRIVHDIEPLEPETAE